MVRLAVSVWLPPDVITVLSALHRPAVAGVRWSTPEQWMVKLRPFGHVDERAVAPGLQTMLAAALDGAPAPRCVLGPATHRPPGEWLVAPVRGLDELAAAVFDATAGLVPVTHPQPFEAHVVLARGRVPRTLAGQEVGASWVARSVSLVADRSSPRGARFEDLGVFPLG